MQQYQATELSFTSASTPANPWLATCTARFCDAAGQIIVVPAFYDGEQIWRVRFTPPAAGTWHYTLTSDLADLDGKTGTEEATPAAGDNPLFEHGGILRVASSGRYLTYTDGTPFFWLGDTWWTCPSDHMPIESSNRPGIPSMVRHLLNLRRKQGFNILHMAFLKDIRGVSALDFRHTLDEPDFDVAFWRTVDTYIREANEAGFIPAIALSWAEAYSHGTLEQWKHLWRYVVARYGAFAVTWLICGEYNIELHGEAPERVEKILAIGQHIHDNDPYKRAMTAHPWWWLGDRHQAWNEPWYQFTMYQGAHLGVGKAVPAEIYLDGWNQTPPRPFLEAETNYEGILKDTPVDTASTRRSAYHAMQCGSAGFTYGAHGIWYPTQDENDTTFENWGTPTPWWIGMQRPGATEMGFMRQMYESNAWWDLSPWPNALSWTAITDAETGTARAAPGSGDESAQENVRDMIEPSVRGRMHSFKAIVYFPSGHPADTPTTLHVTLPEGRACTGRWFNPRTGCTSEAFAVASPEKERLALPSRPAADEDWILLLDASVSECSRQGHQTAK